MRNFAESAMAHLARLHAGDPQFDLDLEIENDCNDDNDDQAEGEEQP